MKNAFDSYYTPPAVADKIIESCNLEKPNRIADFAAGFGSLLESAKIKYPDANYFFNDISTDCINHLLKENPDWHSFNVDFFNIDSVKNIYNTFFLKDEDRLDLILLNPPFSQRGGLVKEAFYKSRSIRCSPALAFVINSLNFLRSDGELVALLPASCFTSDKDADARILIETYFHLTLERKFSNKTFSGCSVNTICIRISRKKNISIPTLDRIALPYVNNDSIKIFRGKLSVHKSDECIDSSGWPLIHTTSLRNNTLTNIFQNVNKPSSSINGPCILMPRVSKPSLEKIVIYRLSEPIVLTDCIIALFPSSQISLDNLYTLIHSNWDLLKSSYSGTCAQYITLKKMAFFFSSINVHSTIIDTNEILLSQEILI